MYMYLHVCIVASARLFPPQWNVFALWKWKEVEKKMQEDNLCYWIFCRLFEHMGLASSILQLSPAVWNRRVSSKQSLHVHVYSRI